jgi:hypothetical protein
MILHGSIGPSKIRLGNGMIVIQGESAENGVLSVHFNKPVSHGSVDSLTMQEFFICVDLKSIPPMIEWVAEQIGLLKMGEHCHGQLPLHCHYLLYVNLSCHRFPEEAMKYLSVDQISDCKSLAQEALPLMCMRYGFNAKDLMDDIKNPESPLWEQLCLAIDDQSKSKVDAFSKLVNVPKKELRILTGISDQGMTKRYKNGDKWGYFNITETTVDITETAYLALKKARSLRT